MTTIHPAASLFPMMGDEEIKELADDIAANGLRIPVVYAGELLVDGRNRLRACEIAGVEPTSQQLPDGYTDAQILDYIVSANIHRRHLTAGQKAMVATELEPMYAEAARERQREHGGTAPGKSKETVSLNSGEVNAADRTAAAQAAKATGTSRDSVNKAKALKRDAPDLAEKVANGMSLNAADKERKKRKQPVSQPKPAPKADNPIITDVINEMENRGEDYSARDVVNLAAEQGVKVSVDTVERKRKAVREARNAAPVDWDTIPGNQREKLDRAKQSIRKELEREFQTRLLAEVDQYKAQTDEAFAKYKAKLKAEAEVEREERNQERERYKTGLAAIRAKGVLALSDYKLIKACLHPDSRDSVSHERLAAAFRIFNDPKIEMLLVKGQ